MSLYKLFILCLSCLLGICIAYDVDPVCSNALTHNGTHKHLGKYIGTIQQVIGVHTDKSYTYKIGICVPPDPLALPNCGIVQYEYNTTNSSQQPTVICIGLVTKAQVTETNDHLWVELTYSGGSNYHSHCGKERRKGRLIFICDPLVTGKGKIEFLEENRDDDLCYYLFTVASKQVCGSQISPGDIILILIASLIVIWIIAMLVGCVYKRMFLGSKGFEQIPLISLYREFGNLEADGCDLICRSSGSSPPSQYRAPAPPFSAETDDDTDEEKDDNLLPM